MELGRPYALFLGDAPDALAAKTGDGVCYWRPEWCVGQVRLPGCGADLGLEDMTVAGAAAAGARTLVVGVANAGGVVPGSWIPALESALHHGMDVANGLHARLSDQPALVEASRQTGRRLVDVRYPEDSRTVATGADRLGKRLLTVGTDCSVGKMYTALALEAEMRGQGLSADFRATGQTGIFIAGEGVCLDAVVGDFMAGAAEGLCPDNAPDHWDVVEGQGSLHHPSYAGVTLALLHGVQPDALVLCHEPTRVHMRGLPHQPLPDPVACLEAHLNAARLTNPAVRPLGIAANTRNLDDESAQAEVARLAAAFNLPAVDPVRHGVAPLLEALPA